MVVGRTSTYERGQSVLARPSGPHSRVRKSVSPSADTPGATLAARTCSPFIQARLEKHSIPEPNSGCLLWTGSVSHNGYGQLGFAGKYLRAHRVAWELAHGPIPDGLFVCHKCDVPGCINPDHLFLDTHVGNMRDMVAKGRSPKGDPSRFGTSAFKLTADCVRHIRASTASASALAKQFRCSTDTIYSVRQRLRWGSV